eukprot:53759-Hanusia_phi.AAC.2
MGVCRQLVKCLSSITVSLKVQVSRPVGVSWFLTQRQVAKAIMRMFVALRRKMSKFLNFVSIGVETSEKREKALKYHRSLLALVLKFCRRTFFSECLMLVKLHASWSLTVPDGIRVSGIWPRSRMEGKLLQCVVEEMAEIYQIDVGQEEEGNDLCDDDELARLTILGL